MAGGDNGFSVGKSDSNIRQRHAFYSLILGSCLCFAQQPAPVVRTEAAVATPVAQVVGDQTLNLLGKTDTQAGEAKRNENVSFDLVDNNALKEQNARLGTSATIIREFK